MTFERAFIHVLLRTILALEWFLPSVLADVTLHVAFLKGEGRYGVFVKDFPIQNQKGPETKPSKQSPSIG